MIYWDVYKKEYIILYRFAFLIKLLYNSRLLIYNYVKITVIYSKLLEILLQKLDTAEFCNRINC